jgi:K+-sensing histidine kinase KdpD
MSRRSLNCNMSSADRVARFLVALFCFVFVAHEHIEFPAASVLVFIFGALNMVSSLTRFCPAYRIFGVSTLAESILRPVLSQRVSRNFLMIVISVIVLMGAVLVWSVNKEKQAHRAQTLDSAVRLIPLLVGEQTGSVDVERVTQGVEHLVGAEFAVGIWLSKEAFESDVAPLAMIEHGLAVTPQAWKSLKTTSQTAGVAENAGESIHWAALAENKGYSIFLAITKGSLGSTADGPPWTLIAVAAALFWLSVWGSVFIQRSLLSTIEEQSRDLIDQELEREREDGRVREMRGQLERMQEFDAWKTRFTTVASHELRTPVATIQAACDLLLRHASKLNEEQRTARVVKIQSQLDRLSNLLDDLLFFGRSGGDQMREWSEHDLGAVLDGVAVSFTGAAVEFSAPQDTLHGVFDPTLIKRAALKLLEYMSEHSIENQLLLEASGTEDELVISVRDTLVRSDWRLLRDSLESGWRERQAKKSVLTLGLAVAKIAVEVHHGTLEVESSEDCGTAVRIVIPRTIKEQQLAGSEEVEWRPS